MLGRLTRSACIGVACAALPFAVPVRAQPQAESPNAPVSDSSTAPVSDSSTAPVTESPTAPVTDTAAAADSTAETDAEVVSDTEAAPDAATQAAYRQVVTDAIVEFDAGRWAEARALFLRAHELWPSARTLRTLGMTSFELREYPRAVSELTQALSDTRRPLTEAQRSHAQSLIERAKTFVGSYDIELTPPEAQLWVDSRPRVIRNGESLQLGVGSHELVVRAAGHQELRRRINVQGGEELTLQLELTPTPPAPAEPIAVAPAASPAVTAGDKPTGPPAVADERPEQGRIWTWVAAGGAVVLGGVSTGLWLQSASDYEALEKECPSGRPNDDRCDRTEHEDEASGIENLETAHQITLGLAIAAGVGAALLFVIEGDNDAERTTVSLSPGGVSVSGNF